MADSAPHGAVVAIDVVKEYTLPRRSLFATQERVRAVNGISFTVAAGTTFGLVGESGSGKSTLAKLLLKLEKPTSGRLLVDGEDISLQDSASERRYRKRVQAVLQDPYGALNPRLKIQTIVGEPLEAQGADRKAIRDRVSEMLALVGLPPSSANRYPHEFSGGQRQRIGIARAMSVDPSILVLDEAVSALDVSVRVQILNLLRDMQARLGTTYLFIGHDLAVVRYMSSVVGVMYQGELVECGPARDVLLRPSHPYTRRLVDIAVKNQARPHHSHEVTRPTVSQ
jgi:ABC-type glutathione transport system ATPase component